MANHWVVNDQKVMVGLFDDAGKAVNQIGPDQCYLAVPEGIAAGNCKVAGEWPNLSLVDGSADKAGPKWDALRAARSARLLACDWTQLGDQTTEVKALWAPYRQELRDLPANTEDPDNVTWPTEP